MSRSRSGWHASRNFVLTRRTGSNGRRGLSADRAGSRCCSIEPSIKRAVITEEGLVGKSSADRRSRVETSQLVSNNSRIPCSRLCGLNLSLRREFLRLTAGAAVLAAAAHSACAQSYPVRPITLIVPFAPGGGTDTAGRVLAEHLRRTLRQPVVIENAPGANGSIGVGRVARSAPDGSPSSRASGVPMLRTERCIRLSSTCWRILNRSR
jgi:hypothetical protein